MLFSREPNGTPMVPYKSTWSTDAGTGSMTLYKHLSNKTLLSVNVYIRCFDDFMNMEHNPHGRLASGRCRISYVLL